MKKSFTFFTLKVIIVLFWASTLAKLIVKVFVPSLYSYSPLVASTSFILTLSVTNEMYVVSKTSVNVTFS